jgi:hypothetical protein
MGTTARLESAQDLMRVQQLWSTGRHSESEYPAALTEILVYSQSPLQRTGDTSNSIGPIPGTGTRGIDLIGIDRWHRLAPSAARSHQLRIPHQRQCIRFRTCAVTANDWCKRWHYILGLDPFQDIRLSSHWNLLDRMAISSTGSSSDRSHKAHPAPEGTSVFVLAVTADDWCKDGTTD